MIANLLAALLLVIPAAVFAQEMRWQTQAREKLGRSLAAIAGQRQVLRINPLNADESEIVDVELRGGVSYAILGSCDDDCRVLELVVATSSGSELAIDRSGESFPLIRFTPRETGRYRIRVVMGQCRVNPCWYGLGLAAGPH